MLNAIKKAYDMIWSIVAEPEEGKVYTGKVVKLVDFGAFVNFFGKRDGLVHVSQISGKRLNHPNELLKEGQEVKVKLLGFDERGKVRSGHEDGRSGNRRRNRGAEGKRRRSRKLIFLATLVNRKAPVETPGPFV
jgi:polyribonucleotide nucleotidyltransferase